MFDILAKIADLFLRIPKVYQEQNELKRKRKFGVALVTSYLRLLEVVYGAEEILGQLEFFTGRFKKHLAVGDNWVYWTGELRHHLEKQSLNLIRMGYSMREIAEELFILSPESYRDIETLARGKRNAISQLSGVLADGKMPSHFNLDTQEYRRYRFDIVFEAGDDEWDEGVYNALQKYLESSAPHERIAKLKECATHLHKLLSDSFKIEDILWSVDRFRDETTFLA